MDYSPHRPLAKKMSNRDITLENGALGVLWFLSLLPHIYLWTDFFRLGQKPAILISFLVFILFTWFGKGYIKDTLNLRGGIRTTTAIQWLKKIYIGVVGLNFLACVAYQGFSWNVVPLLIMGITSIVVLKKAA